MRVLLIENDILFGSGLEHYLHEEDFVADWLRDSKSAQTALAGNEYFDLVILDLDVPGIGWKDWIASLKSQMSSPPVIVMTGGHLMSKGLDMGADGYLSKRFLNKEKFFSLIWSVLRRTYDEDSSATILKYKNISLDLKAHEVKVDDKLVKISRREFALLHKLLTNVGEVISREKLSQSLYGWNKEIDSNALEVHIHNLRQKLKADFIESVRGFGYKITKDSTS